MIWTIIAQTIISPFSVQVDVNRLSVDIRDEQFTQCQECINELMNDISQVLSKNLVRIAYDDFKKAIYIKLNSYRVDDSTSVVNVLEQKGVKGYVVRH